MTDLHKSSTWTTTLAVKNIQLKYVEECYLENTQIYDIGCIVVYVFFSTSYLCVMVM